MTKTERIAQITEAMKSFNKESYQKAEVLPELFSLQSEMVARIFGTEAAEEGSLKIWDVEAELDRRNASFGHVADEALYNFKNESKAVCNLIKSEVSGNKGEFKAFGRLEALRGSHRIFRNVEITSKTCRTELDGVVLTKRGVFIVEVKNTRRNILIDEEGNYYRMGEYMHWDSNIGEKMQMRETLLRQILESNGYPGCKIMSVIVFTNREVEVKNRDRNLKTTFLGPLPYIIDECNGTECFSDTDLDRMTEAIETARSSESYKMDIDINQYKQDFATVIAEIEEAQAAAERKEGKHRTTIREIFLKIFAPEKVPAAA